MVEGYLTWLSVHGLQHHTLCDRTHEAVTQTRCLRQIRFWEIKPLVEMSRWLHACRFQNVTKCPLATGQSALFSTMSADSDSVIFLLAVLTFCQKLATALSFRWVHVLPCGICAANEAMSQLLFPTSLLAVTGPSELRLGEKAWQKGDRSKPCPRPCLSPSWDVCDALLKASRHRTGPEDERNGERLLRMEEEGEPSSQPWFARASWLNRSCSPAFCSLCCGC